MFSLTKVALDRKSKKEVIQCSLSNQIVNIDLVPFQLGADPDPDKIPIILF